VVVGDIPSNPTLADFSSLQDREIFGSKFSKFHYFCIIFSFVVILKKNFEIYIINKYYRGEASEIFSGIFRSFSSRQQCFLLEKRDFNIFQFGKPAIRDPQGHEICRLMTQSIGISQRNT